MKAYTIDTGSHSDVAVIEDGCLVYIIDESYITIWKSLDDFYNNPNKIIRTIEIYVGEEE